MSDEKQQLAQEEREFISDTVHHLADVIDPRGKKTTPQDSDTADVPPETDQEQEGPVDQSELVTSLREENSRLLDQLGAAQQELVELRKLKATAADFVVPNRADLKEAKIIELAKRNRDYGMNLAKANRKIAALEKQVRELETQIQATAESQESKETTEATEDLNHEKLLQANTTIMQLRSQLQATRQELAKTQRALQREVGDQVNIQSILLEKSSWRGRAQEISLLQERIKELKERLASYEGPSPGAGGLGESTGTTATGQTQNSRMKDHGVTHRLQIEQMRQKRLLQQEEEQESMQDLRAQLTDQKQRMEAVRSRNKILEENQVSLSEKLNTILEKTKHDDEFIQALQAQNQVLKRKLASASAAAASGRSLGAAGTDVRETILAQERQIARQEQIIRSLRTELDALTTQMMEQQ